LFSLSKCFAIVSYNRGKRKIYHASFFPKGPLTTFKTRFRADELQIVRGENRVQVSDLNDNN